MWKYENVEIGKCGNVGNVEMWKWRKSRESGVGSSESENVINMVGSECGNERKCENVEMWRCGNERKCENVRM